MIRAYTEIVDFIAGGSTPAAVASFTASEQTKDRVAELIRREKSGTLDAEAKAELNHFVEIEHIMRLAKAKARQNASK